VAFVATREGSSLDTMALRAHCAKLLPSYMMPDEREKLSRLPRGSRGKVDYGILDSIAVMQLLMFLEATFDIEFGPRDLDRRRLDTIEQIEELVRRKIEESSGAGPAGTGAPGAR